jgi:AraC-like DNA-binding protein
MIDLAEICKILEFISAFVLIIFSLFILVEEKGNRLIRYFLAAFLMTRAILQIAFGLLNYPDFVYHFPDIAVVGEPFLFLYAPFLFLYTKAATRNDYTFKKTELLHFLPAVIYFIYFVIVFHSRPVDDRITILETRALNDSIITNNTWLWLQFAGYCAGCIYLLVCYKNRIRKYNSSYDHERLAWLNFLVLGFLVWKGIFISGYLFNVFDRNYALVFKIFIDLGFLFYSSMIIFKGLQQPHLVLHLNNGKTYRNSPMTENDKQQYLARLNRVMIEEKLHLNANLTLKELARTCQIPEHYLSQLLNEGLHQNFYNYVNYFRVEEAKQLLSDPENKYMTVLEILYTAGFNSKSVFNTAFKKHERLTPTEYRRRHLKLVAA